MGRPGEPWGTSGNCPAGSLLKEHETGKAWTVDTGRAPSLCKPGPASAQPHPERAPEQQRPNLGCKEAGPRDEQ